LEPVVLVVDDDPAIIGFVEMALSDEGYRVETASNGREALAEVEKDRPNVILLDLTMPVMNGYEFYTELKKRMNGSGQIPVVVMTAGQRAREAATELGASGYLAKPFQLDDLIDCVEKQTHKIN
jgi:CheY-like chemotaxis protein